MKRIMEFSLRSLVTAALFFGCWVGGRSLFLPDDIQARTGLTLALILGPALTLWTRWGERRVRAGKVHTPPALLLGVGAAALGFWVWIGFIAEPAPFQGSERWALLAFALPPLYLIWAGMRSVRAAGRGTKEAAM